MTTGEKITALRKKACITQEEFADRLGVTRQAVSKWESGSAYPETDTIIRIAELFGVTCDYLLRENAVPVKDNINRKFITMMTAFALCLLALGFLIGIICYYAVSDWWAPLLWLGIWAGLSAGAFVLYAIARYRYLKLCEYVLNDRSLLSRCTRWFYTAVLLSLALLLQPLIQIGRSSTVEIVGQTVSVPVKLAFGEYVLTASAFVFAALACSRLAAFFHLTAIGERPGSRAQMWESILSAGFAAVTALCLLLSAGNRYALSNIGEDVELLQPLAVGGYFFSALLLVQGILGFRHDRRKLPLVLRCTEVCLLFLELLLLFFAESDPGLTSVYSWAAITESMGAVLTALAVAELAFALVRRREGALRHIRYAIPGYAGLGLLIVLTYWCATKVTVLAQLIVFALLAVLYFLFDVLLARHSVEPSGQH